MSSDIFLIQHRSNQ